jgi:hypothetical protein
MIIMKDDVIRRQDAIDLLNEQINQCDKALGYLNVVPSKIDKYAVKVERASLIAYKEQLESIPSAQPEIKTDGDTISRQVAIDLWDKYHPYIATKAMAYDRELRALPSAQPEKEIAKRVLWSGWKGTRDTRYKCPMCKKPVKNDDVYCHRCGQKLMFPHISFTDYVPGEKQQLIVRWDDEE